MSLRETFSQYGEVVEARIVMDQETGKSRGFAFVNYTSSDEASGAIQALDGKGRTIRVNYAAEKSRTGGFGNGGYGYVGGYGYSSGYGYNGNDY